MRLCPLLWLFHVHQHAITINIPLICYCTIYSGICCVTYLLDISKTCIRPCLQGDSRLANQLLQQCQLYGLPQVGVGVCRQMGVHQWQAGRTAAAISWFIRGACTCSLAPAFLVVRVSDAAGALCPHPLVHTFQSTGCTAAWCFVSI